MGWGESCTAFLREILLPGHEQYSACPNYSPRESLGTSCPPVLSTPPCHPPQQVTDAWEFSSLLCNIQLQACLGCSQSLGKHILDPAPCAHFQLRAFFSLVSSDAQDPGNQKPNNRSLTSLIFSFHCSHFSRRKLERLSRASFCIRPRPSQSLEGATWASGSWVDTAAGGHVDGWWLGDTAHLPRPWQVHLAWPLPFTESTPLP